MRRVLRPRPPPSSTLPSSLLRKSVSMDGLASTRTARPLQVEEEATLARVEVQAATPEVEEEEEEEERFQEVEERREALHTSTLGAPVARSRSRIVPMMRKMFEKAKSCDPDVASPPGDGTESSRSQYFLFFFFFFSSTSFCLHLIKASSSALYCMLSLRSSFSQYQLTPGVAHAHSVSPAASSYTIRCAPSSSSFGYSSSILCLALVYFFAFSTKWHRQFFMLTSYIP